MTSENFLAELVGGSISGMADSASLSLHSTSIFLGYIYEYYQVCFLHFLLTFILSYTRSSHFSVQRQDWDSHPSTTPIVSREMMTLCLCWVSYPLMHNNKCCIIFSSLMMMAIPGREWFDFAFPASFLSSVVDGSRTYVDLAETIMVERTHLLTKVNFGLVLTLFGMIGPEKSQQDLTFI